MQIRIRIYLCLKIDPNTNTNNIQFESICRIGKAIFEYIQIPNYSPTSVMMTMMMMMMIMTIFIKRQGPGCLSTRSDK